MPLRSPIQAQISKPCCADILTRRCSAGSRVQRVCARPTGSGSARHDRMRIIGGKFRGRTLAPVPKGRRAPQLRPTSARARTVMFDLLIHGAGGDLVAGARVLDLFAGTGALGLEALSRGAAAAVFVDNRHAARQVIRRNILSVGAEADTSVMNRDAGRLGVNAGRAFSLVFLDPPYGSGLAEIALRSAVAGGWIKQGGVVVAETPSSPPIPDFLSLFAERQAGLAWIGVFEVSAEIAAEIQPS